jgi:hypothetical protein
MQAFSPSWSEYFTGAKGHHWQPSHSPQFDGRRLPSPLYFKPVE